MAGAVKKSTIYLNDDLHKAIKHKSAETGDSISAIIEDALKGMLTEDLEDLKAIKDRRKEKFITYEQLLKNLKKDGII